jgi:2-methylcitrate dehydratase PrpD
VPALAVAEELGGVSGKDLIVAVALGNEITSRVSAAIQGTAHDFPWFRAPVVGLFGATAAAAKIMRASRAQHLEALGLALPMVGGTFASLHHAGSSVRSIRDGVAYRNGVLAAAMAMRGLRGDKEVFEGPFGYYKSYFGGRYDRDELVGDLGKRHESGRISLKPWPSCRHLHGTLTAVLQIMESRKLSFGDVASVEMQVGKINQYRSGALPADLDAAGHIDFLCNLPFAVATAILHKGVPLKVYQDRALRSEVVAKALPKVKWRYESRQDGSWTFEPGRVEITTVSGERHQAEALLALGHPDNPMSFEQQQAKFLMCAQSAARPVRKDRAMEIIGMVSSLEQLSSIGPLVERLA